MTKCWFVETHALLAHVFPATSLLCPILLAALDLKVTMIDVIVFHRGTNKSGLPIRELNMSQWAWTCGHTLNDTSLRARRMAFVMPTGSFWWSSCAVLPRETKKRQFMEVCTFDCKSGIKLSRNPPFYVKPYGFWIGWAETWGSVNNQPSRYLMSNVPWLWLTHCKTEVLHSM